MFKSHFNEVIILQLLVTSIAHAALLLRSSKTVAISKTNSHSAGNPFRKQALFNAYQTNVFECIQFPSNETKANTEGNLTNHLVSFPLSPVVRVSPFFGWKIK
jgi:hypothetical protein